MEKFDLELDRYMQSCTARGLTQKTMRSYDQTLRLFIRYIREQEGITDPAKVKRQHVEDYILHTKHRGKYTAWSDDGKTKYNNPEARTDNGQAVTDTTLANYQRNLTAFFNWLYEEKVVRKNPVEGMKKIRPQRKVKQLLTEQELRTFLLSFDTSKFHEFRDWMIARMILDTGARISELLATVGGDVAIRHGALLLRETKSGHERFVYFSEKTGRFLRSWMEYKDRYSDSPYNFPSTRGNRMKASNVDYTFRRHSELSGVSVQPHVLRNNFAKYYLMNGGDWLTLSRLLGHSSPEVTQKIYLDFKDEDIRNQYQKHSPLNNLRI